MMQELAGMNIVFRVLVTPASKVGDVVDVKMNSQSSGTGKVIGKGTVIE